MKTIFVTKNGNEILSINGLNKVEIHDKLTFIGTEFIVIETEMHHNHLKAIMQPFFEHVYENRIY